MMRSFRLICMAAGLLALGGCAATASPGWDADFGDSSRALKAQQLIDPAAPQRNAQQVPHGDGRTIVEAGARHVDSYRSPPPPTVVNIGVGGGTGR